MAYSYIEAAECLMGRVSGMFPFPKTAVILGTGLDGLIEIVSDAVELPYSEIPGFPSVDKKNHHKCRVLLGKMRGIPVAVMHGRLHYYEGYSMQELAFPIQMLKAAGVETIIMTNASGAVNDDLAPGDVVMIDDHIKLGLDSPLRGKNFDELGERFFDMTCAYNPKLKRLAEDCAHRCKISLKRGVYAYMTGPQFETPAEIRMLKTLGADLVGMSTVPEVIAAAHCGMRVLALSGVTNMAAGLDGGGLNQKVIDSAEPKMAASMIRLINEIILEL